MSPERIVGEEDGIGGDVYAVAVSIAELILRRPLGRSPVIEDRHATFVSEQTAEISNFVYGPEEVQKELIALLQRGLAYDIATRPSVREMSWRRPMA